MYRIFVVLDCTRTTRTSCFAHCRMNRLNELPRGFGAFPALEVLDLTYNNLNEKQLPGNFFCLSEFDANVWTNDGVEILLWRVEISL